MLPLPPLLPPLSQKTRVRVTERTVHNANVQVGLPLLAPHLVASEWTAEQLLGSMCQMRITKKAREQDLPAAALPHLCLRADISGGGSTLALDPAVQLVRTSGFPLCCRAR